MGATAAVFLLLLTGAFFAASTRAAAGVGLGAAPLDDGEDHSSICSTTTSSSGGSASAASAINSEEVGGDEACESEPEATCTSSTTTATTTQAEERKGDEGCESDFGQQGGPQAGKEEGLGTDQQSNELKFRIIALSIQDAPAGYRIGQGEANIEVHGITIRVHVELEKMNPETHYKLLLSVNGVDQAIGDLTTSNEGNGHVEAVLTLQPGNPAIGLSLQDTSTFNPPKTVMGSIPTTLTATIAQETASESETDDDGSQVTTTSADHEVEGDVRNALNQKTIPAVVHWSESGTITSLLDPTFTVSVGRYRESGLLVSISGNATGPRVLLVNLTRGASPDFGTGSLIVTLDGNPVQQASFLQVLNSQLTDPARYIVLSTASGWQLLVSIPHFSLHTLAILPVVASGNVLMVDAPLLVVSFLAVSSFFAFAYARRTRLIAR